MHPLQIRGTLALLEQERQTTGMEADRLQTALAQKESYDKQLAELRYELQVVRTEKQRLLAEALRTSRDAVGIVRLIEYTQNEISTCQQDIETSKRFSSVC